MQTHRDPAEEEQYRFGQAALGLVEEAAVNCSRTPKDKLRVVPHVMASFTGLTGAIVGLPSMTEEVVDRLEGMAAFIGDVGQWGEKKSRGNTKTTRMWSRI